MSLTTAFFTAFAGRPRPDAARIIRPAVDQPESNRVRDFLAAKTPAELTVTEIRDDVGGNLWMLTPEVFLYFLPAFMEAALESYDTVSVFAAELINSLTEPSRQDVIEALDQLAQIPAGLGLPPEITDVLRKQQLEWFDSGLPTAMFQERFSNLSPAEGAAIHTFLAALQEARGEDFPFGELETAIQRYWHRYEKS